MKFFSWLLMQFETGGWPIMLHLLLQHSCRQSLFLDEFCQLQQLPKKQVSERCLSVNHPMWLWPGISKVHPNLFSVIENLSHLLKGSKKNWVKQGEIRVLKGHFAWGDPRKRAELRAKPCSLNLPLLTHCGPGQVILAFCSSAGFPPVPPPWSSQGSSCNLGRI